ncbi:MAG: MoaD/ThiS family protein [Propionibacterium sp.]
MATVSIPSVLRTFTERQSQVSLEGANVGEVVASLAASFPDLAPHILDDSGNLRSFVNVFVGDTDIRSLQGPQTPVSDETSILLVPAIAGGAPESTSSASVR